VLNLEYLKLMLGRVLGFSSEVALPFFLHHHAMPNGLETPCYAFASHELRHQ
jgi:hypothetical protein